MPIDTSETGATPVAAAEPIATSVTAPLAPTPHVLSDSSVDAGLEPMPTPEETSEVATDAEHPETRI
jgi:hypothetical protein